MPTRMKKSNFVKKVLKVVAECKLTPTQYKKIEKEAIKFVERNKNK